MNSINYNRTNDNKKCSYEINALDFNPYFEIKCLKFILIIYALYQHENVTEILITIKKISYTNN